MAKDISNQRFGRLFALRPTGEKRWGVFLWFCQCDCGTTHVAAVNSLCAGKVQSCGCLRADSAKSRLLRHGEYKTRTYQSWDSMVQRCTNPSSTSYARYGAKGVSVCDSWRKYENFRKDLGVCPPDHSLDRIDPAGNYEPGNCRWVDSLTQARNKQRKITTYAEAEEVRRLYAEGWRPKQICAHLKLSRGSVNGILYLGQISRI